ncbi:MAG: hypothetical protein COB39_14135 [Marinosulfonomonas sp.]|nr:MAG: hypothetical protein COB39_14135 [Marinosulfonomonas sp.]
MILRNLNNTCIEDGTRSLLERVSGDAKASTDAAGSKAQARALLIYTTTGQLQNGDAVLREFPGGYKNVLQYFKTDVPVVRFKFVKNGETSGMAFDGLDYVNDPWVIMPKPWRALP